VALDEAPQRRGDPVPRYAVIDASTPRLSFAEALAAYEKGGAQAIGITESRLGDLDEDLARLRASGLRVSGCFLTTYSILPGPEQPRSFLGRAIPPAAQDPDIRVEQMIASMRRLAPFDPDVFFALTGPRREYEAGVARALVVDGLRRLAAAADELHKTVALEMFDPILDDYTFIHTIPDAVALLDEVDRPNIGLAIDVWHLGAGAHVVPDVRTHAHRVASVHLNDRRDPTRCLWDRVLPGDGIADLPGILGALDDAGFDGWFELEILSDDGSVEFDLPDSLWRWDAAELVSAGRARLESIWAERRHTP
jgi:sugar phosphate isomerase/epimerase